MTLIWIGHVLEFQSFGNGIESLLGTGSLKSLMSALSRLTVFFLDSNQGSWLSQCGRNQKRSILCHKISRKVERKT